MPDEGKHICGKLDLQAFWFFYSSSDKLKSRSYQCGLGRTDTLNFEDVSGAKVGTFLVNDFNESSGNRKNIVFVGSLSQQYGYKLIIGQGARSLFKESLTGSVFRS
jgi:hypothetical protein